MSKIDFSKAPEGATHYAIVYGNNKPDIEWICLSGDDQWVKMKGCVSYSEYKCLLGNCVEISELIPSLTVESVVDKYAALADKYSELSDKYLALKGDKTERELMLCGQVLRMCRGEASEFKDLVVGEWYTKDGTGLNINTEYRAKPKKELVVPWEWLPNRVTSVTVHQDTSIRDNDGNALIIKLDLTGIDLPVTVERPKC